MPSVFDNAFATAAATFHSVFGQAATYTPAGGSATPITLLVNDLRLAEIDRTSSRQTEWMLTAVILGSEIASPERGDALTFNGRAYKITGNPTQTDNGLDWIVEALSTDTTQRGGTEVFPDF